MTSTLYAIADAGGNVYPGTFATLARTAKVEHAGLPPFGAETKDGRQFAFFGKEGEEWFYPDKHWATFAAKGDHVVLCTIETHETITVTTKAIS